jgi:hypothetical protein
MSQCHRQLEKVTMAEVGQKLCDVICGRPSRERRILLNVKNIFFLWNNKLELKEKTKAQEDRN